MSTFLSFYPKKGTNNIFAYFFLYSYIYHPYSRRFQRCARHLMDLQSPLWEQLPLIRHFPRQQKNTKGKRALSLEAQKNKGNKSKKTKGTNPSHFPSSAKNIRGKKALSLAAQKNKGSKSKIGLKWSANVAQKASEKTSLQGNRTQNITNIVQLSVCQDFWVKNMCRCLNSNTLTICNL